MLCQLFPFARVGRMIDLLDFAEIQYRGICSYQTSIICLNLRVCIKPKHSHYIHA